VKKAYADVPEGQMHYRCAGKGEVLLLLHMAGSSSDQYERVAPFLSDCCRVIAPDYMGFGESDKPSRPYQIIDHAKSIIDLMDTLHIQKASVGGTHVGATISVMMADKWPERVNNLVVSCLPYYKDQNEFRVAAQDPVFQRVEIQADGGHLLEWWRRAARYGDPAEIVEERMLCMHKAGPRGEEIHWAIFTNSDLGEQLAKIKIPTLVIAASRDFLSPRQKDVQAIIPGSQLVTIEGGGVYVDRTMPKEFAKAILRFLIEPRT
jgi:pimeloyl-ACP methyl ester carboxylesterase